MKRTLILLAMSLGLWSPRAEAQKASDYACTKPVAQPRGVGTAPDLCPPGAERLGALCYAGCPANMRRAGVDCHSVCPAGLRDDGLFCRAEEYTRKSYGWEVGDHAIAWEDAWWNGIMARCEAENGRGNCERGVGVGYPKCRPGYTAFVATCRPNPPDCTGLGLLGRIDLSCTKDLKLGVPVPASCGGGKVLEDGLCYARCPAGYDGVGALCAMRCPDEFPRDCGAQCAFDVTLCGTFDVVSAPACKPDEASTAAAERASVLDPAFYLAKYPDLRSAFGNDLEAARAHWLQNGIREGRDASRAFSLGAYLARYDDLQKAFANDYEAALDHWFAYGRGEKRDPRPDGTYMADPRADVLDPVWYANSYADVKAAFGYRIPLLVKHWLEYGIREGRKPRATP